MIKNTIPLLLVSPAISQAATTWQSSPNAVATASWDTWSFAPPVGETGSGSQGSAQASSGTLITSSDLTTEVIAAYEFPGGLGTNPDTYYFHTGAGTWTANLLLSEAASHVRVSYSLLGFGGAPPEAFFAEPFIAGASIIGSGFYSSSNEGIEGTVFFSNLELGSPATEIETTFGDRLFPGFPGSFRSVDGVKIEFFNGAPIPEPSSATFCLASFLLLRRRRRN